MINYDKSFLRVIDLMSKRCNNFILRFNVTNLEQCSLCMTARRNQACCGTAYPVLPFTLSAR